MKRIVFLVLTFTLLLLSEAITLLATGAESATKPVTNTIQADSIGFFYRQDEKTRFLELKNQWQSEHRGEVDMNKAISIAEQAYQASSVDAPLTAWRYHGGPSPWIMTAKVHLFNDGTKAYLNVPLAVTVRARGGDLRVNPALQLTDFSNLEKTARWLPVSGTKTITIPAFAPGEDMLLEVTRFSVLDFLSRHPNRWPTELEVQVSNPQFGAVKQSISLLPDHFVMPSIY